MLEFGGPVLRAKLSGNVFLIKCFLYPVNHAFNKHPYFFSQKFFLSFFKKFIDKDEFSFIVYGLFLYQ